MSPQMTRGRFEWAHKGTLFLEDMTGLPLSLQEKLGQVFQSRRIIPVGGKISTKVDIRVMATARKQEISSWGEFQEALFSKWNYFSLEVPPLRERREDIPLLVDHFLKFFSGGKGEGCEKVTNSALDILFHYNWPGNVRELENLVERLVLLKEDGPIEKEDLPAKFWKGKLKNKSEDEEHLIYLSSKGMDIKKTLSKIEDDLILQALQITQGNKNKASKLLGLNRTTLI